MFPQGFPREPSCIVRENHIAMTNKTPPYASKPYARFIIAFSKLHAQAANVMTKSAEM